MSDHAVMNHINRDFLYEDGSIDIVAVQRNASRLRNHALRQMVADIAHGIAQFVRDHRPHGTPVRG